MSRPLTHQPFAGLEPPKPEVTIIRRRTTDPESGLKLVRQIRAVPLPTDPPPNARLTPDPSEDEAVAGKKSPWTEERKAKMRATIAAKKERGEPVGAQARFGKKKKGKKKSRRKANKESTAAFVLAHPDVPVDELVKLAADNGITVGRSYIYNLRSNSKKTNGAVHAPRKPKRQGIDAAIAAVLEQSPLDTVLDMLRLADHAKQTLGAGSKKRLLSELTSRLS